MATSSHDKYKLNNAIKYACCVFYHIRQHIRDLLILPIHSFANLAAFTLGKLRGFLVTLHLYFLPFHLFCPSLGNGGRWSTTEVSQFSSSILLRSQARLKNNLRG